MSASRPSLLELERGWDGRLSPTASIPEPGRPPSSPVLRPSHRRRSPAAVLADSPYAWSSSLLRPNSSPGRVVGGRGKGVWESGATADEEEILLKVQARETLLKELRRLLAAGDSAVAEASDLCRALRHLSLEVALAVQGWQAKKPRSESFLFNGASYLHKLHSDMDILDQHPPLLRALGIESARSNPFLLRRVDGRGVLAGGIIDAEASGLGSADLARFVVAENAVLREVAEWEARSQPSHTVSTNTDTPQRMPSSPSWSTSPNPMLSAHEKPSSSGRSKRRRRRKKRLSFSLRAKKSRVRRLLSDVEELRGKREEVDERVALLQSELRLSEARRRSLEAKRVAAVEMRKESLAYKLGLDVDCLELFKIHPLI